MKFLIALLLAGSLLGPARVFGHCDGLDGPVVNAAQTALENGDINVVLIWVQEKDEGEIKTAFRNALAVRKLSPEAKALADTYFFETLVRIHRAGEGAAYTGLKPAGRDLGPAVPAVDEALVSGSVKSVAKLLGDAVQEGLAERFREVIAKKTFKKDDVEAGREYVKSYVEFIHYAERLYDAAKSSAEGHFREAEDAGIAKRAER
jgi:Family of unknown function (DUF6448)